MKPMVRIHDLTTDKITDREMNDSEFADYQATAERLALETSEAVAKEAARQALLDKLGITADEAKLLLG
jgi:hypothetical protein